MSATDDAPVPHPEELEFRAYVRGRLGGSHAGALLAHCLVCETCLQRLHAMVTLDTLHADGSTPKLLPLADH